MSDNLPRPVTMEFRDGKRLVPEYLAEIMAGIETFKLTYVAAVAEANKRIETSLLNEVGEKVVADHFRAYRRWE